MVDLGGDLFENSLYNDSCTFNKNLPEGLDQNLHRQDLTQVMAINDTSGMFIHTSNSIMVKPLYNKIQDCKLDVLA